MLVSPSSLHTLRTCFAKYFYTYECQLRDSDADTMLVGKAFHDAIRIMLTSSLDEATNYLRKCAISLPVGATACLHRVKSILDDFRIELIELELVAEVAPSLCLTGRLDAVGSIHDSLFILEFKTTKPHYLIHKPNDQVMCYTILARKNNINVDGLYFISVDFSSGSCSRHLVTVTDSELDEWLEEVTQLVNFYKHLRTVECMVLRNTVACTSYGVRCPYLDLCSASPELRLELLTEDHYEAVRSEGE